MSSADLRMRAVKARISAISARQLPVELAADWVRLQGSNPALANPFFCPEFTNCVSAERSDAEVAVIEEEGKITGLFPFQRDEGGGGRPVGGCLSDYQGIICADGFSCEPMALVRGCGLRSLSYDHWIVTQEFFAPYHEGLSGSPVMDLSAGFEAYLGNRSDPGSELKNLIRKRRKIEREVGALRFEEHSTDRTKLECLIGWKSAQYRRTGAPDRFKWDWFRGVVERVHATSTPGFGGMLSVLYAGNEMVAAHLGMRSRTVWHYWFPAYDPVWSAYSPGLLLLLKMAENAARMGIEMIDLGRGSAVRYKRLLMSHEVSLARGTIERPSLGGLWRRSKEGLRRCVKRTPLEGPARRFLGWWKR